MGSPWRADAKKNTRDRAPLLSVTSQTSGDAHDGFEGGKIILAPLSRRLKRWLKSLHQRNLKYDYSCLKQCLENIDMQLLWQGFKPNGRGR